MNRYWVYKNNRLVGAVVGAKVADFLRRRGYLLVPVSGGAR